MRIATWNVERPTATGWKVPPAQVRRMAEVDADVWVLTETRLGHGPSDEHAYSVFSPAHPDRRSDTHERWAAIWSRWPLTLITDPAAHRRGTVAAIVESPAGRMIVFGTVIAWSGEEFYDDGTPASKWQVHLAEIERQGAEWFQLRAAHPDLPFIVAGDFNRSKSYGTKATWALLDAALVSAGLVCVTADDALSSTLLHTHDLVDHICLTPGLAEEALPSCWERIDAAGQTLSDHPVVAVDLVQSSGG